MLHVICRGSSELPGRCEKNHCFHRILSLDDFTPIKAILYSTTFFQKFKRKRNACPRSLRAAGLAANPATDEGRYWLC